MATKPTKIPGAAEQAAQSEPIAETPVVMAADVPNAIDVDLATLKSPLLTRQGWLVPAPVERKA
jgi:hypothetical protein